MSDRYDDRDRDRDRYDDRGRDRDRDRYDDRGRDRDRYDDRDRDRDRDRDHDRDRDRYDDRDRDYDDRGRDRDRDRDRYDDRGRDRDRDRYDDRGRDRDRYDDGDRGRGSYDSQRRSKKGPWIAAAAAAVVLAVVAGILVSGVLSDDGDAAAGEILLEPTSYAGSESFTGDDPSVICPPRIPDSGEEPLCIPRTPPTTPVTEPPPTDPPDPGVTVPPGATTPRTPSNPGKPQLYGGTGDRGACDPDKLVAFLAANPAKAKAWVDALNSDPNLNWDTGQKLTVADIPRYVAELTSLILNVDTRVTNHGFVDLKANPIQSVLQRGTAVLVDKYGVPRVKCYCGNPLLPPRASSASAKYTGTKWAGFDPKKVVTVEKSTTPITEFEVVMPDGTLGKVTTGITLVNPPATGPATTVAPATAAPATAAPTTAAPATIAAPVAANPFEGTWNFAASQQTACEANGGGCNNPQLVAGPVTLTCSAGTCDSGNGFPLQISGNTMTGTRPVAPGNEWTCDGVTLPTSRTSTWTVNPDGTLTYVLRITADPVPPSCPNAFLSEQTAIGTR